MLINPKYLASHLTFFTWFYAVFSTGRASTRVGSNVLAVPTNNVLELWCSCSDGLLKAAFSLESRSWSTVAELAAIQKLKRTTLWLTLLGAGWRNRLRDGHLPAHFSSQCLPGSIKNFNDRFFEDTVCTAMQKYAERSRCIKKVSLF